MKEKVYLQITSGRGPAECCWVVALVLEKIVRQAQARGLKVEMIEREVGAVNRPLLSAVISLQGAACDEVVDEWEAMIPWGNHSAFAARLQHFFSCMQKRFLLILYCFYKGICYRSS